MRGVTHEPNMSGYIVKCLEGWEAAMALMGHEASAL